MRNRNIIHWTWLGLVICLLGAAPAHAFYNPQQGRWLNRDPLGEEGAINLYQFVFNNPTYYYDSDGKQASMANPAGPPIAGEYEAAAAGYRSYAAWQAALREAARQARIAAAAALALSQSQCSKKPKNDDPCKRFEDLLNGIRQQAPGILGKIGDVVAAKGSQVDLNAIPGMTQELKQMLAAMYQAAADCYRGKKDVRFNDERAKWVRGERETAPGKPSDLPPL